jgi:glycyl-tRNA synthetase
MAISMDDLVSLCKRRGIIFQGSEIYNGLAGTFDYGPIGNELKQNVKRAWWRAMVYERNDVEGLDAAILMHPSVWEASGHVAGFSDPLCDCKDCKKRFRGDHIEEQDCLAYRVTTAKTPPGGGQPAESDWTDAGFQVVAATKKAAKEIARKKLADDQIPMKIAEIEGSARKERRCPECGGELSQPRQFNLMFKTHVGPVEDTAAAVYLRPETAQGMFVNFENVRQSMRRKLPFGIAQMGKAFRNEITPRNFIFRTREFELMEVEFFCKPGTDDEWFDFWVNERMNWYLRYGIKKENLRLREHAKDELAHYAKACKDVEYNFPIGWSELEGIANRTDFDLNQHMKHSGKDLLYFDEETKTKYIPYVIEPALGADRCTLAFLVDSYREETVQDRKRVVLGLHYSLAPIKAAVFPLLANRSDVVEKAMALTRDLKRSFYTVYDDTAAIGKLYRRQDEIGTPFCITVDVDSMTDGKATVRERDSMKQERVAFEGIKGYIKDRLEAAEKT